METKAKQQEGKDQNSSGRLVQDMSKDQEVEPDASHLCGHQRPELDILLTSLCTHPVASWKSAPAWPGRRISEERQIWYIMLDPVEADFVLCTTPSRHASKLSELGRQVAPPPPVWLTPVTSPGPVSSTRDWEIVSSVHIAEGCCGTGHAATARWTNTAGITRTVRSCAAVDKWNSTSRRVLPHLETSVPHRQRQRPVVIDVRSRNTRNFANYRQGFNHFVEFERPQVRLLMDSRPLVSTTLVREIMFVVSNVAVDSRTSSLPMIRGPSTLAGFHDVLSYWTIRINSLLTAAAKHLHRIRRQRLPRPSDYKPNRRTHQQDQIR
jgi:hypothetical protein